MRKGVKSRQWSGHNSSQVDNIEAPNGEPVEESGRSTSGQTIAGGEKTLPRLGEIYHSIDRVVRNQAHYGKHVTRLPP
jgi:hypothetical protein